jgi:hypothetical protein
MEKKNQYYKKTTKYVAKKHCENILQEKNMMGRAW